MKVGVVLTPTLRCQQFRTVPGRCEFKSYPVIAICPLNHGGSWLVYERVSTKLLIFYATISPSEISITLSHCSATFGS